MTAQDSPLPMIKNVQTKLTPDEYKSLRSLMHKDDSNIKDVVRRIILAAISAGDPEKSGSDHPVLAHPLHQRIAAILEAGEPDDVAKAQSYLDFLAAEVRSRKPSRKRASHS